MSCLRSSADPASLQGILKVSTIRSDRSVNDQLGSYPLAQPLARVRVDSGVGRTRLPQTEVVRPSDQHSVQAFHHVVRRSNVEYNPADQGLAGRAPFDSTEGRSVGQARLDTRLW